MNTRSPGSILRLVCALGAVAAALFSGAASTATVASLTPLGDLPGGIFDSFAAGVSADGATVVGQGSSTNGNEAFLRTAHGGMVELGDLPGGAFFPKPQASRRTARPSLDRVVPTSTRKRSSGHPRTACAAFRTCWPWTLAWT